MLVFIISGIVIYLGFRFIRSKWESETLSRLWNRPVLITGCDSGFGHDSSLRLAKMGVPVYAGCFTEQGLGNLQTEASNLAEKKLIPFLLDVTSDESVGKMGKFMESECERYGGLWAVINNAGVGFNVFLDDFLQPDDYRSTIEVNLYGIIRVVHRLRKLIKKKRGRIINVTSIFGRCPAACIGPYMVSKHAANAYTDAIRKELSLFKIDVITIEPGFVKTPITNAERIKKGNIELWQRASPELKDEYGYEFFQKTCENQAMMMNGFGTNSTEKVTDAYVKAVTSAYPRLRYKIGWDTALLWHPLTFLPTYLQDAVFYTLDKIAGGPRPARALLEQEKEISSQKSC